MQSVRENSARAADLSIRPALIDVQRLEQQRAVAVLMDVFNRSELWRDHGFSQSHEFEHDDRRTEVVRMGKHCDVGQTLMAEVMSFIDVAGQSAEGTYSLR